MSVTIKDLRHVMRAQPFRPFWLCLADGLELRVVHPDFIAVSPTGRGVSVYSPAGDMEIADILLATRITFRKARGRKGSGKRRSA